MAVPVRATVRIGAPMVVAAGLSDEEFEGKKSELENVLKGMEEESSKREIRSSTQVP